MANRWGNNENRERLYFLGLQTIVGKAAGESFTFSAPAGSFTMKVVSVTREG